MKSPQEHYQRASEAMARAEKSAKRLFFGLLICTVLFIAMVLPSEYIISFGEWYMHSSISTIFAFIIPLFIGLYFASQNLKK